MRHSPAARVNALLPKTEQRRLLAAMEKTPSGKDYGPTRDAERRTTFRGIKFAPPAKVRQRAVEGLELVAGGHRGGTSIGFGRAVQLATKATIYPRDVYRMVDYFRRHTVDLQSAGAKRGDITPGVVAWLLWGGDEGRTWAKRIVAAMDAAQSRKNPNKQTLTLARVNAHLRAVIDPSVELIKGKDYFYFTFGRYGMGPSEYVIRLNDQSLAAWTAYVQHGIRDILAERDVRSIAELDALVAKPGAVLRFNPGPREPDRTHPTLWADVVRAVTAGSKGGKPGQWSARKAQIAVTFYKAEGGGYIGPKSPDNSLTRWTRERWRTKSGRPSLSTGERYLPEAAIDALSDAEYAATTRAKRSGLARGEQFTPQPPRIAAKVRPFRK